MIGTEWSLRLLNLGGAASNAGIKAGDHILEINGLNVRWDKLHQVDFVFWEYRKVQEPARTKPIVNYIVILPWCAS